MLVLLRIGLGWHFLYQGIWKLNNPSFTSAGFLRNAKGPFAEMFHSAIPDLYGQERLDEELVKERWKAREKEFADFFKLDEDQQNQVDKLRGYYDQELTEFHELFSEEIVKYKGELQRYEEARKDPSSKVVGYQKERLHDKRLELLAMSKPWIETIDELGTSFEEELHGVLNDEQKSLGTLPRPASKLDWMDTLVTFSNIAIGACLMLGLFTRFAAACGAMFLLSIVLAQPEWPTIYPPAPPSAGRALIVNKEFIEMMVLATLATLPVGRWAGLDFFVHNLLVRPLRGKGEA
jgi:uncharacterized membrane protein YphA (DoxX/SURF4 family)